MVEAWLFELVKGIGKLFLNPLAYWGVILLIVIGIKRIRNERKQFGHKIFDVFSESKHTWMISIISGILLSLMMIGVGIVFSYETILMLSIVMIILSITIRTTLLSPSYTIGFTYILLLFIPYVLDNQSFINVGETFFAATNFTGLVILLGLMLIIESILLRRIKQNESFPELVPGNRGRWVGQHRLKKASIVPFFILVPSGLITPIAPFWPYFSLGENTYSLLLVPFLLGFDHVVRGSFPKRAGKKMAQSIGTLGVIVLLIAAGSIYVSWFSLAAVVVAVLGREFICYQFKTHDKEKSPYFHIAVKGLKVLAIIPGTPADRLGILVGETICKVNGRKVSWEYEFYQALQHSGAFVKLEIIDVKGENRIIQSALYQNDHHELGIMFAKEKHYDDVHYENVNM